MEERSMISWIVGYLVILYGFFLFSDHDDIENNPEKLELYEKCYETLEKFMGSDVIPAKDVVLSVYGKVGDHFWELEIRSLFQFDRAFTSTKHF